MSKDSPSRVEEQPVEDVLLKGPVEVDDDEEFTLAEQRKIIHKIDRRLLIILGAMQAVSFLDRANMSNAAIAGMTKDLELGVQNRYVSCPKTYKLLGKY